MSLKLAAFGSDPMDTRLEATVNASYNLHLDAPAA